MLFGNKKSKVLEALIDHEKDKLEKKKAVVEEKERELDDVIKSIPWNNFNLSERI